MHIVSQLQTPIFQSLPAAPAAPAGRAPCPAKLVPESNAVGMPTTNGARKGMVFTPEGVCLRGKNELVVKRACGSEKKCENEREMDGEKREGKGRGREGMDGWEIGNENISTLSSRHSFRMTTVLSIPTPTHHHDICPLPQNTHITLDTLHKHIPTQILPCMLLGFWFP